MQPRTETESETELQSESNSREETAKSQFTINCNLQAGVPLITIIMDSKLDAVLLYALSIELRHAQTCLQVPVV